MAMTMKEFLAQALKRDEEARMAQEAAVARVDAYYAALGAEIEAHPIGLPTPHGGGIVGD